MSVRDNIEAVVKASNVDFFGVASIDRFEHAPTGKKPTDILPTARSVISLGIKIPRGALVAQEQFFRGHELSKFVYLQYGLNLPSHYLDMAAMNVARMLEAEYGQLSVALPTAEPYDRADRQGVISNRHVACAAGLGEIGWNNLVINPDVGCAGRYGVVLTDMEIKPDPLYRGEPLCNPEKCGLVCVRECPINAFSGKESVSFQIDGQQFHMAVMDRVYCQVMNVLFLDENGFNKQRWSEIKLDVSREQMLQRIKETQSDMRRTGRRPCARCIIFCPVTREKVGI